MKATAIACAISAAFGLLSQGCSSGGSSSKSPTPTTSTQKPPSQAWKAAVGDGGTLLETFDDASWDLRKISEGDLYGISCIDNEVGWVVGAQGFVGHTEDGGWSWPEQTSGVTSTLRAVSFAKDDDGAQVGLAAGDAGTLLASQDGGASWAKVELAGAPTSVLRGTAITEGATLLVAVGDGGLVARSSDGGRHFDTTHIDGAADLYDVALDAAGGLGLAVDSAGSIWLSRDGAKTFEREYQATGALEGVSLGHSGALASAAGAGVALLRANDGVWTTIGYEKPLALHATLVGPHEDRVYFAGESASLLETVDNGRTLSAVPSDAHAALRGLEDLEAR